jgi:hypothetical protein
MKSWKSAGQLEQELKMGIYLRCLKLNAASIMDTAVNHKQMIAYNRN